MFAQALLIRANIDKGVCCAQRLLVGRGIIASHCVCACVQERASPYTEHWSPMPYAVTARRTNQTCLSPRMRIRRLRVASVRRSGLLPDFNWKITWRPLPQLPARMGRQPPAVALLCGDAFLGGRVLAPFFFSFACEKTGNEARHRPKECEVCMENASQGCT